MMYATDAFRALWESHQGPLRTLLVKIDFAQPSAKTIRLSTRDVRTPDGSVWENLIASASSIDAQTDILRPGPDLVTTSIEVARAKLGYQDNTLTILDVFQAYDWQGAVVTEYLWVDGLASFSDALQVFSGTISGFSVRIGTVRVNFKQDSRWNRLLPDQFVTKTKYPGAPDALFGQPIPVIFGDRRGEGLLFRSPFQQPYWFETEEHDLIGGGTLVDPGLVVDTGRASGKVQVIYSSHKLGLFALPVTGTNLFMRGDDKIAKLNMTGVVTQNDEFGARMTFSFADRSATIGVLCSDIRHGVTTQPANALAVLDIFDTRGYATLLPGQFWEAFLTSGNDLGDYYAVPPAQVVFWSLAYSTEPGTTLQMYSTAYGAAGFLGTPNTYRLNIAATDGLDDVRVAHGWYFQGGTSGFSAPGAVDDWYGATRDQGLWNFDGGVNKNHNQIWLTVRVTAGTKARLFWGCIRVTYVPSLNVINPGLTVKTGGRFDVQGRDIQGQTLRFGQTTYQGGKFVTVGAVQELQADFFFNSMGHVDDGAGTYSDTPNGVVVLAPDVAHLILSEYGKVAAGKIENASGYYGSFVDARNLVRTIDGARISVGRSITEKGLVADALGSLAEDTASYWFINRFTGKHSWIPWDIDALTSYTRVLGRADLLDDRFEAEVESESFIASEISVAYGWDAARGRNLHTCTVGPNQSSGGFADFNNRDNFMTVMAGVNDKLDFSTDADGIVACTLPPGDYTPATLVQWLYTQMNAVAPSAEIRPEYGFEVVAGYNDQLKVGSTTITLAAGSFHSGARFAEHVQDALAAALPSTTWVVTYGWNGVFTIAASSSVTIDWTIAQSPAALMGFRFDVTTTGTTHVATYQRNAERWSFMRRTPVLTLLCNTGVNLATSAWPMLGFPSQYDRPAKGELATLLSGQRQFVGFSRRGYRERQANASREIHGTKPPITMDNRWVNSSVVASSLRDRIFDWRAEQPLRIHFATLRMPDIERGMVFETDETIDALVPYPRPDTSTTWDGRKFMVLEVRQNVGTRWDQEIVAVELARILKDAPSEETGGGPPGGDPGSTTACDQCFIQAGINDLIEWGGSSYTIPPGVYSYGALAKTMEEGMRLSGSGDERVSWRLHITLGHNDDFSFYDLVGGGVPVLRTVVMPPGHYNKTSFVATLLPLIRAVSSNQWWIMVGVGFFVIFISGRYWLPGQDYSIGGGWWGVIRPSLEAPLSDPTQWPGPAGTGTGGGSYYENYGWWAPRNKFVFTDTWYTNSHIYHFTNAQSVGPTIGCNADMAAWYVDPSQGKGTADTAVGVCSDITSPDDEEDGPPVTIDSTNDTIQFIDDLAASRSETLTHGDVGLSGVVSALAEKICGQQHFPYVPFHTACGYGPTNYCGTYFVFKTDFGTALESTFVRGLPFNDVRCSCSDMASFLTHIFQGGQNVAASGYSSGLPPYAIDVTYDDTTARFAITASGPVRFLGGDATNAEISAGSGLAGLGFEPWTDIDILGTGGAAGGGWGETWSGGWGGGGSAGGSEVQIARDQRHDDQIWLSCKGTTGRLMTASGSAAMQGLMIALGVATDTDLSFGNVEALVPVPAY